jgi:hydrogenase expression/formation protein HypC
VCLAVPGRVVEWLEREPLFASARVDFGGIQRVVNMACVPDAGCDDYVLVHAGIAISRIAQEQAEQLWRDLEAAGIARSVSDDVLGGAS